jgi:undecaprenyl-diphosphatase
MALRQAPPVTVSYAALLGIVQGLTEFLPISSSAHLILARALLGWDFGAFGLAFDVACHGGTLAAVVLYFRSDLAAMTLAAPRLMAADGDRALRLLRLVLVGTLPIAVAGLVAGGLIEDHLRTPLVVVVTLAAGGVLLLVADRPRPRTRDEGSLSVLDAVGLGCAQAVALVPGVSRSGATLILGLMLGLRRDAAARFSFLLGVPAILAALVREALVLWSDAPGPDMAAPFAVGVISSAVVGYLTVKYFLRYVAGHGLAVFAWYRLALAVAVLAWMAIS